MNTVETVITMKKINLKWFKKYAANNGITPKKFSKDNRIDYRLMEIYDLPNSKELEKTEAVFCSYFLNGTQR